MDLSLGRCPKEGYHCTQDNCDKKDKACKTTTNDKDNDIENGIDNQLSRRYLLKRKKWSGNETFRRV